MIDMQTTRVAALNNRVPSAIVLSVAALLTASMLTLLIFVSLDLDRPTRGLLQIPSTPLTALQDSMEMPPAATSTAARSRASVHLHGQRPLFHGQRPLSPRDGSSSAGEVGAASGERN